MEHQVEAYLDIETTGLSPEFHEITVIGIYIVDADEPRCVQMFGDEITVKALEEALKGVDIMYTYNGSRFDLPFIYRNLGIDLQQCCDHRDLMYDCWKNDLRGGLKSVEKQLGIPRALKDMNGYEAVKLWWKFVNDYDAQALAKLIRYNREDIVNLKILKDMLLN